jgi:CDP-glycerol glycerophosphotransferase (TagB/SpsB family)
VSLRSARPLRALARRFGVHRAALLLGLVRLPLLALVSGVVRRLPRDPNLVVMGSPLDRFADNAAYLYLHLAEHPQLRAVWISGSTDVVRRLRAAGHLVERRWSWAGMRTTLRAGTFVYSSYRSDINHWLSAGATTVCLWHGLPIKLVEGGVVSPRQHHWTHRLIRAGREAPPSFLLSSSEFVTACFSPAFGVPAERCWELGYPRDDHLLAGPATPPPALVTDQVTWQRLRSARRVVGLFLTWRDDRIDDAVDETLLAQLVDVCRQHSAALAYKAHYNVAPASAPATCVLLPPDADLHAYLGLCDILVTDYSSIALDFLLMRRPVVYFMPDVERYRATRGFAVDPLALPGFVTLDPDALVETIAGLLQPGPRWQPTAADDAFLRSMWGGYRGDASQAIARAIAGLSAPEAAAAAVTEAGSARSAG